MKFLLPRVQVDPHTPQPEVVPPQGGTVTVRWAHFNLAFCSELHIRATLRAPPALRVYRHPAFDWCRSRFCGVCQKKVTRGTFFSGTSFEEVPLFFTFWIITSEPHMVETSGWYHSVAYHARIKGHRIYGTAPQDRPAF